MAVGGEDQVGKNAKGIEMLEAFLKKQPDHPRAEFLRERIERARKAISSNKG